MPPRPSFTGFLRLSLVSVPVKAVPAAISSRTIRLNQLHSACHNRVRYQKICPEHGELSTDEIVKGFEYTKGQYVIIEADELAKLRRESDKAIDIRGFVGRDEIDPMFFSGRTYFLVPDGPVGQKPYHLLVEAMSAGDLYAVATAVLSGKEQLAVVRPMEGLLGLSVLTYRDKLRSADEFRTEIDEASISDNERALTSTLIEASTLDDFDMADYQDEHAITLRRLIDAKVQGEEIVAAPERDEPQVINLMEALKASVESATAASGSPGKAKMASGAKKKTRRGKKTG